MKDTYDEKLYAMVKDKEIEMIKFLNMYLSPNDLIRIGEDIVRIMPTKGDIAKIKMELLSEGYVL